MAAITPARCNGIVLPRQHAPTRPTSAVAGWSTHTLVVVSEMSHNHETPTAIGSSWPDEPLIANPPGASPIVDVRCAKRGRLPGPPASWSRQTFAITVPTVAAMAGTRFVWTKTPAGGRGPVGEDFTAVYIWSTTMPQDQTLNGAHLRGLVRPHIVRKGMIGKGATHYLVADVRTQDRTKELEAIILTRP